MSGWIAPWAKAQITGIVVSSVVWIMVAGLSVPAFAVLLLAGVAAVAGRNTRAGLWWRFAARRATSFEQQVVLEVIVPIASLRGRNQPAVWVGRRLRGVEVVMVSRADLVVSPEFLRQVACGQLTDRQASARVSHALGQHQLNDSVLVNAVDAHCLPWRIVQVFSGGASQIAARSSMLRFSWKVRWIVFGAAIFDSYRNARWAALVGVLAIALLSWSTRYFQKRWVRTLELLGDQRTFAEGLGPDLADLLQRSDRSLAASERTDRLRRGTPDRTTGGSRLSCDPDRSSRPIPPADHLERRGAQAGEADDRGS